MDYNSVNDLDNGIICYASELLDTMIYYTKKHRYDDIKFIKFILQSDVFKREINLDISIVCQSYFYISELLDDENNLEESDNLMDSDVIGFTIYLFYFKCIMSKMTGSDIINNYNILSIYNDYEYLHCMDLDRALEEIDNSRRYKV